MTGKELGRKQYKDLTATDEMISTMADDYSDIEANGDPSSVTSGQIME